MINNINSIKSGDSGEHIALLHGWGFNAAIWQETAHTLANNAQVNCIDLPGHGHSPMPADDYNIETLADQIAETLPKQGNFIGWSLGGMVAMQIALRHPQKIKKLILVASIARFVHDDDWRHAISTKILQGFSESLNNNTQQTLQRFIALQIMGSDESRVIRRRLRELMNSNETPHPAALQGGLKILREVDLRDQLSKITQPTLMIFGKRDTLSRPKAARQMLPLLPDARLEIIDGAGHAPFLSHNEHVTNLIKQFIKEQ
ncbi:MAG: pimeloyl-ACP methyl ester esterase BioH [Gammaproteobacteria bacterium]|nr:pimeloyl-ACP methyl ester esterase BioH [Gammaproteobacteria bacterium]